MSICALLASLHDFDSNHNPDSKPNLSPNPNPITSSHHMEKTDAGLVASESEK